MMELRLMAFLRDPSCDRVVLGGTQSRNILGWKQGVVIFWSMKHKGQIPFSSAQLGEFEKQA
jgi:hypothetical protein